MSLKKQTGSYYTPTHIANFMVKRFFNKSEENRLTILEPSAGDGEFIRALSNNILCSDIKVEKILAVEISETESNKIKKNINLDELDVVHADFLDFQTGLQDCSFDLVIGNPPYVKRNYLSDKQIELCAAIHAQFTTLSTSTVKNIWSSFLVRSISLLAENGILALVLPSELLQVKYAEELRELLLNEFERIEVFTFNELLFKECKGQDTLILIAEKKIKCSWSFFL
jgi:adenine-specific DNA-methyltransferase